jgi:hypothetical protein
VTEEQLGLRLFALGLRLLPAWLRVRTAGALLQTFRDQQQELLETRGRGALPGLWVCELTGLIATAWRGRRPDPWSTLGARQRKNVVAHLPRDFSFAVRALARRPAAAALAAVTLALGVGASVAMFSVVNAVLLRPLPFHDPDDLVAVYPTLPAWRDHPSLGEFWEQGRFANPEYAEWKDAQTSFELTAAYASDVARLAQGQGEPEQLSLGRVTTDFFTLLGVRSVEGRFFLADDAGAAVVVLSHHLWQRRFGGDAAVIGRTVLLDDNARTVIGVLPREFQFTAQQSDAWIPMRSAPDERQRDNHELRVIARLRAGVALARAEEESARLLQGISPQEGHMEHGARVHPLMEDLTRRVRAPLLVLMAAAALLLATACANVATLVLGMGIDREAELAVRAHWAQVGGAWARNC